MARSKSSKQWLKHHFNDTYVKAAQEAGYRSRAVFKLKEIQEKTKLIQPGMHVVDLGAAPGGWSELAREYVGKHGKVFALDRLAIEPISDVHFIQGDFTDENVLQALLNILGETTLDLVISDMAPNMSGHKAIDIPKAMYLCELALDFAINNLRPGGGLLMKVFHGAGFDELLTEVRAHFTKVSLRKPKASSTKSRETYLLALDLQKTLIN